MIAFDFEDEYSYTVHQTGYCSTLPPEDPDWIKEALEKSVEEITGKSVELPAKLKMGFY